MNRIVVTTAVEALEVLLKEKYRRKYNSYIPTWDKWTMRNGEAIYVKDMTDRHLNNAINMVKRNINAQLNQQSQQSEQTGQDLVVKEFEDSLKNVWAPQRL